MSPLLQLLIRCFVSDFTEKLPVDYNGHNDTRPHHNDTQPNHKDAQPHHDDTQAHDSLPHISHTPKLAFSPTHQTASRSSKLHATTCAGGSSRSSSSSISPPPSRLLHLSFSISSPSSLLLHLFSSILPLYPFLHDHTSEHTKTPGGISMEVLRGVVREETEEAMEGLSSCVLNMHSEIIHKFHQLQVLLLLQHHVLFLL